MKNSFKAFMDQDQAQSLEASQHIKAISEDFKLLDFNQPGAHECFREMAKQLGRFLVNIQKTTWRDLYFFDLGCSMEAAQYKFNSVAPVPGRLKE